MVTMTQSYPGFWRLNGRNTDLIVNVRPRLPVHNHADSPLSHTVLFAKRPLRFSAGKASADFADLFVIKFCKRRVGSANAYVATARDFLAHIFKLVADREVMRRDAPRVVATMKNKKPGWDGAVKMGVGVAVGAFLLKPAVTVFIDRPGPVPAIVAGWRDLRNKLNELVSVMLVHRKTPIANIGMRQ